MKISTALFILIFPLSAFVAEADFPSVQAEKLDGTQVEIPKYFDGDYTLIGIASSQKAEDELRTWQAPVYNKFIAKTGLMDDMYDVEVCFLPLFTGASRMAKAKVIKKLKEENNPLVSDYLYVYTGEMTPFKEMGMDDKKKPHFFLLDEQGKILWEESGAFSQSYFDKIEEILNGRD